MKASWSSFLVLVFLNIGVFCSIGQGIRVTSAYYGPPNSVGVDVTRRVQQFADYGEPFRVGRDTLRIDPSPNHRKVLVVIYEANGQRISDSVGEGDVFYFRSGEEADYKLGEHRPAVQIIRALYGAPGHYADVTGIANRLAREAKPFTVSNETFGVDPYPNHRKALKISYLRGKKRYNQQYEEGDRVRLE